MPPKPALTNAAETGVRKASLQARKLTFVRDAIWTAAMDLFAINGFEETTVEDIVEAAGTSRRTFFRHYESKRDLMALPVVSYGESISRAIASAGRDCLPADLLGHVVMTVAQDTVADPRMRKVMEISAKYPAAREAQVSRIAELQDQVADAFAHRCKDEVTAHVLAALTLSALRITYRVWFAQGRKDIAPAVRGVLAAFSRTACAP